MDNNFNNNQDWQYGDQQYYTPPAYGPNSYKAIKDASSAQTLGIVGLIVSLVCCPLIGIILGIIAISRAKSASMALGYVPTEAKTGRICGIIAIVLGVLSFLLALALYGIYFAIIMEEFGMLF